MNERTIQVLLMQKYLGHHNHVAVITNSNSLLHTGATEVDLLTVTRAGLVHEFEIKCTISDYRAEFRNKRHKHQALDIAEAYPSHMPNYFWFVTHGFLVEPPEHAGWIQVIDQGGSWGYGLDVVKQAPRLHKRKWDSKQVAKIARLLSFRLMNEYKRSNGTNRSS